MTDEPKRLVVVNEASGPRATLQFEPNSTIYLASGHVPIIRDDEPLWRRLDTSESS